MEETCENSDSVLRADTESSPSFPEMVPQRIPRKIILPIVPENQLEEKDVVEAKTGITIINT